MTLEKREFSVDITDKATDNAGNPYADRVVTHKRIGVWDFYEEMEPDGSRLPSISNWTKKFSDIVESFPYLMRMAKDILSIPDIQGPLLLYLATQVGGAVIPATSIW